MIDIATVIASFVSGLLCSMGFGGGSVLIIYLTSVLLMGQKEAQGINLLFFIPIALYSVIRYNKKGLVSHKPLLPFIIFGILGVLIGYGIISFLPEEYAGKCFGILLIFMGLKDLFSKKQKK